MSRLGTCKYAFKIQEMRSTVTPHDDIAPCTDRSSGDEYLCSWLSGFATLPPPVMRRAGGMMLMSDDCDHCHLYQAPEIAIPGVRTTPEHYSPIPATETDK